MSKKRDLKCNFISARVTKSFKELVNNLADLYAISKTELILNLLINHMLEVDFLKNLDEDSRNNYIINLKENNKKIEMVANNMATNHKIKTNINPLINAHETLKAINIYNHIKVKEDNVATKSESAAINVIDSFNNNIYQIPPKTTNELKAILIASEDEEDEEITAPLSMAMKVDRLSKAIEFSRYRPFQYQYGESPYFQTNPPCTYEQESFHQVDSLHQPSDYRLKFHFYNEDVDSND